MRQLLAAVAAVLCVFVATRASAEEVKPPKAAAKYIAKLERAIDRGNTKAFLALLPARIAVGSMTYTKADLRRSFKEYGGIAAALWLPEGAWTIEASDGGYLLIRGDRGGDGTPVLEVTKRKGTWRLREVSVRYPPQDPNGAGAFASRVGPPGGIIHLDDEVTLDGTGGRYGSLGNGGETTKPEPAPPPPMARLGQPTITGDLGADLVRRYLKRNLTRITGCYQSALADEPGLQGTVTISFTITADGSVSASEATGLSTEVATCIAAAVKKIPFAKPGDGADVTVTYPIEFQPPP
jgi:hypothetical protein